jgi:hypothetical protein
MQLKRVNLIAPSSYQETLSDLFATEVFNNSSSKETYLARNSNSRYKATKDIYLGKMAEFAVYNFLISQGKKVTFPDIAIYQTKQKSNDADLVSDNNLIHVKSCMLVSSYPISWLFQPTDEVTINPKENDFFAFTICTDKSEFYGYFAKSIDFIGMYRDPKLEHLKKKVIYEEDLIK